MDSQECKEILSEEFGTESKEWKRVSKKKINGHTVRVFTHPEQEDEVWFITDEDDSEMVAMYPFGKNGHVLLVDEDDTLDEDGMGSFLIVDKDFYDRENCVNSVHLQHLLEIKYGIDFDSYGIEEVMESCFAYSIDDYTKEEVIAIMEKHGIKHLEE